MVGTTLFVADTGSFLIRTVDMNASEYRWNRFLPPPPPRSVTSVGEDIRCLHARVQSMGRGA
jgi:hypothetical protein